MKLGETLGNVASFVAVVGAGVVLFKFYKGATALVDQGAKVGDAIVTQAKKTIGEDLNPASDKNVIYTGVNSLGRTVTKDDSFNLGARLWEFFNADKVAKEKLLTAPAGASDSNVSNVQRQAELMDLAQDNFRRAEIEAANAEGRRQAEDEAAMSNARSAFRLSEYRTESGAWSKTDSDQFFNLLRTHG